MRTIIILIFATLIAGTWVSCEKEPIELEIETCEPAKAVSLDYGENKEVVRFIVYGTIGRRDDVIVDEDTVIPKEGDIYCFVEHALLYN